MNWIRIPRPIVLALALLGTAGPVPAIAQSDDAITSAPSPEADRLAEQVRALAANPRDLQALITAGELSVRLGDTAAALAFFGRAEAVDPANARVSAGRGAVMVRLERPGEALGLFAEAEKRGLAPIEYASDRGLAYDLVGQPALAQHDYRLALTHGNEDETVRRLALSLGITGQRDEAMTLLDPLLRRSDRAAWRARAFILAMTGDPAGAEKIATTMMPGNMGMALMPFFRRLPGLSPADRAFAVHFGELTPTQARIADARLAPPMPAYVPPAPVVVPAQVAAAPAAPSGRSERRSRRGRERSQPAVAAAPPVQPQPAPLEPPRYGAPVRVAEAGSPPVPAPVPVRMPTPKPVTIPIEARPAPSPIQPAPVLAAATERSYRVGGSQPPVVRPAEPAQRPETPAVRPGFSAAPAAASSPVQGPARPMAQLATSEPPPIPKMAPTRPPEPVPAPAQPEPEPLLPAAVESAPAASPAVRPIVAAARPARPEPRPVQPDPALARIVAGITIPASELGVGPSETPPAVEPASVPQSRLSEAKPVEARTKPEPKPVVAEREKPAPKAKDDKAAKDAKAKARNKPDPAKAEPARAWVQVAGGADVKALPRAWAALVKRAPAAFKGRSGWTTPLRATNRLLTGPFKNTDDAQAFVNALSKEGMSAFVFTSEAGQKIEKLPAK